MASLLEQQAGKTILATMPLRTPTKRRKLRFRASATQFKIWYRLHPCTTGRQRYTPASEADGRLSRAELSAGAT